MFAKFSGTDDSSWDIGCICCELLESSADSVGGGTDVTGGSTEPTTTWLLLLLVVVVTGPAGCGAAVMVTDTDGVPGICCCAEDSAGDACRVTVGTAVLEGTGAGGATLV